MGVKFENKKFIQDYIRNHSKVIEKTLIREMEIIIEKLINHAKQNPGYKDITGNLKGSIGGFVLKDGYKLASSGFEGEGGEKGKSFINSIISEVGTGYAIIIVAGMEYASYVEEYHNLNVLKKTELLLPNEMNKMFNKIKSAIDKSR